MELNGKIFWYLGGKVSTENLANTCLTQSSVNEVAKRKNYWEIFYLNDILTNKYYVYF